MPGSRPPFNQAGHAAPGTPGTVSNCIPSGSCPSVSVNNDTMESTEGLAEQMSPPTGIEKLPIEIISKIFSYLVEDRSEIRDPAADIKNVRRVSKRFCEVSSPHLIEFVRIYIRSKSLDRLEEVAKHPIFSKSVRTIEVNVSFYDAALVRDRSLFARSCSFDLYRQCEVMERMAYGIWKGGGYNKEVQQFMDTAFKLSEEWRNREVDDAWWTDLTGSAVMLRVAHERYGKLVEDQENLKQDGSHLRRLSEALARMPGLKTVIVSDRERRHYGTSRVWWRDLDISDEGIINRFMKAYQWKAGHHSADFAEPPTELLFDLFNILHKLDINPVKFELRITPPNDLAALKCDGRQLETVSNVLKRATDVAFIVDSWDRKDSLAVDNSRPHREMVHLGRLSAACFKAETLRSLTLHFRGYPSFGEPPQIRLSEILPTARWPDLKSVFLIHIPMTLLELTGFIERQRDTITSVEAQGPWLFEGTWAKAVRALQGLEKLQRIKLVYLMGGVLGTTRDFSPTYNADAVEDFILGRSSVNPLQEVGRQLQD